MDHQRSPPWPEEGMGPLAQGNPPGQQFDLCRSIGPDYQVGKVTSVRPLRILGAVLLAEGIEMATRRLEIRSLAACLLMDVEGVHPRRQMRNLQPDSDPAGCLPQRGPSHFSALSIDQNRPGLPALSHAKTEKGQAKGGSHHENH